MPGAAASPHSGDRFVLVRSGGEWFAIPVGAVVTVLRELPTHPVPGAWARVLSAPL